MGYQDNRRYPDFTYLSNNGSFDQVLDCIIISHFHLDHCGSLPYFTEICGYNGPIYMTYPTKSIAPILLEDMRKVMVDRKGETNFFTSADIRNCLRKVIAMDLHEIVKVTEEIEIKAYYAGHVLGAALFHIRVTDSLGGSETCVYTGDYNMTPDRHLGSAWIDECRPDLLITESTYATTIRDSKRARERDFLRKGSSKWANCLVHDAVKNGGKVLVPVFALGRAQELLILIESYWERMSDLSKVPIYFSAGLTERANDYYKLFISWTNEKIKKTFVDHNMFDFRKIKTWKQEYADEPGPMVLFASPGMLHAGTSLAVFAKWCHDPLNMIIMPGYCVAGTVGAKVLAGEKNIEIDRFKQVQVNMQVKNLSFSAHADAKGILSLISMAKAKNVLLVHGEKEKMAKLKERIEAEMKIPCFDPGNGETVTIRVEPAIPILLDPSFLLKVNSISKNADDWNRSVGISGCIIVQDSGKQGKRLQLLSEKESAFKYSPEKLRKSARKPFSPLLLFPRLPFENWKQAVRNYTVDWLKKNGKSLMNIKMKDDAIMFGDVKVQICDDCAFLITWDKKDESMAIDLLSVIHSLNLTKIQPL